MTRISPTRIALFSLAALCASSFADVVTLTSGEKVEGKILSETDAEITIAAKVSASITDERIIKRSEIATIAKDAPDEVAWQGLKGMKLGRSSLPLASYDSAISPLNSFVAEFPKSQFAPEAQKLAEAFTAEKKRVEAGEVKLDDKWLSKEEAQKERMQIGGLVAFNFMKDQAARDMTAAMNTFDALEKNFAGTRSYPNAVEFAQKMLPALKAQVEQRLKALTDRKSERDKSLAKLTGAQKTALQDEIKREQASIDAAVLAAEKSGLKWLPLNPANERSLRNLGAKVSSEIGRLNSLPVQKMRASIASAEKARALLVKKEIESAEAALAQATSDWSNNELAARLRTDLAAEKSALAAAAATAAAAKPEPVPEIVLPETPAPVAAAPAPPVAEEVVEEKPFLLTAGGAITVVVLVALLFAAYTAFKKIKAKAGEVLE